MPSATPKLEHSAQKLKESAAEMEDSTLRIEDSADRRTQLAANRTVFAAERTYAAWMRTGLFALASGVGARALLKDIFPHWMTLATGSVMILFAVFCFAAGVWRELYPGPPPPVPDAKRIPHWILIVMNGVLILATLAALAGIWFGRTPTG